MPLCIVGQGRLQLEASILQKIDCGFLVPPFMRIQPQNLHWFVLVTVATSAGGLSRELGTTCPSRKLILGIKDTSHFMCTASTKHKCSGAEHVGWSVFVFYFALKYCFITIITGNRQIKGPIT